MTVVSSTLPILLLESRVSPVNTIMQIWSKKEKILCANQHQLWKPSIYHGLHIKTPL